MATSRELHCTHSRPRFPFLDGLRGLAALYVVFHHAYFEVAGPGLSQRLIDSLGAIPNRLRSLTHWLDHGTLAVDVFIVLSGFCLMLPVASSRDQQLGGGLLGFVKRRGRRILPPYFAAVFVSLLLIACVPLLSAPSGDRWDHALPAFTSDVILSHLLLVHNLSREWIWKINNPLWSVATEWQIYFVFALILLPTWRRLGAAAGVSMAIFLGCVAEAFSPPDSEACFHFVGLFGFGMLAADVRVGYLADSRVFDWPWKWIGSALSALTVGVILFVPDALHQPKIVVDNVVGLVTASLLLACASSERFALTRLLESKPLHRLGKFSYSLYLMHFPFVALGHLGMRAMGWGAVTRMVLMLFVVVPVTMALCYAFYRFFERPFVLDRQRQDSGTARLSSTLRLRPEGSSPKSQVPLPAVGATAEHAKPALG